VEGNGRFYNLAALSSPFALGKESRSPEPPGRFGEKTKLLVAAGIKTSVYPTRDLF
jgi:hypothetical protein